MRRLGLSALAFVGLLALVVGIKAARRVSYVTTRPYDREPY